jgi:hypothetical protein
MGSDRLRLLGHACGVLKLTTRRALPRSATTPRADRSFALNSGTRRLLDTRYLDPGQGGSTG